MTTPKPLLALCLALAAGALLRPAAAQETTPVDEAPAPAAAPATRTIDLAICLDTSGSMDGLIDSARRKIWAIVNDLALAKPTPRLRVALLTYGNDGHPQEAGWVAVHSGFTEDLDAISQQLFSFRTNGGTELVGRVLKTALDQLDWQDDPGALKLAVVAGNESADQDREAPFRDVCRAAIARGVMVNAIYCVRPEPAEVAATWRDIARLSDGHFAAIDQNDGTVDIATPFDERLAALSKDLNGTYVAFGGRGDEGKKQQRAQDANAEGLAGGAAAERANAKATRLYHCSWCLVDATGRGEIELEDVEDADLPEELRGKTLEEKKAYLEAKRAARARIREKIADVNAKREAWLAGEIEKRGLEDGRAFDAAVREALRAQAKAKGFAFQEKEPEKEAGE